MTNTPTTRSFVIERVLPHAPQKVWRALTQSALIAEWMMPNDFEAKVGHAFQFRNQPAPGWNGIIDCKVIEIVPHRRLVYSWGYADESTRLDSVVTFTLTEEKDGTRVHMEQSGFPLDNERAYQGAGYGWTRFMGQLEKVAGAQATDPGRVNAAKAVRAS